MRCHARNPPQLQVAPVARPRFEPHARRGGRTMTAVRAFSHPFEPAFARIRKPFRNRRPQSALNGQNARQPTPIFRGRLRCAVVDACLSRRRPRVRVPSTPPTKGFYRKDFGISVDPVSHISQKLPGTPASCGIRVSPQAAPERRRIRRESPSKDRATGSPRQTRPRPPPLPGSVDRSRRAVSSFRLQPRACGESR